MIADSIDLTLFSRADSISAPLVSAKDRKLNTDQLLAESQGIAISIVDLVMATRNPTAYNMPLDDLIQFGASPRATINLTLAAKANAFLEGRPYVTPHDVKLIAMDVLRHRVIITYEAEAEEKSSEDIVSTILQTIPVP